MFVIALPPPAWQPCHCAGVNALQLAEGGSLRPEGSVLWTASRDGTVIGWNSEALQPLATCRRGHTDWVTGVAVLDAVAPLLATASADRTVRVWRGAVEGEGAGGAASLRCVAAAAAHPDVITCLAAAGDTLVSAGLGGQIRLWDVATLRSEPAFAPGPDAETSVYAAALDPAGEVLAVGSRDGCVDLIDTRARRTLVGLSAHGDVVRALTFSADGRALASAGSDGLVRVWDLAAGPRCRATLAPHPGPIWTLAASADLDELWTGGRDGSVYHSTPLDGRAARVLDVGGPVSALAVEPASGRLWLASSSDSAVSRWDLTDALHSTTFAAPATLAARQRMSFDREQQDYFSTSAGSNGAATPSSPTIPQHSPRVLRAGPRHPAPGLAAPARASASLAPLVWVRPTTDRRHLLTQRRDGAAELWSVETGAVVRAWRPLTGEDAAATLARARTEVFDPGQAVSAWFSPSIRLGSPGGTLEHSSALGAEAYLRALGVPDAPPDGKIDCGLHMLQALFLEEAGDGEGQSAAGTEPSNGSTEREGSSDGQEASAGPASAFRFLLQGADVLVHNEVPCRQPVAPGTISLAPAWVRQLLARGPQPAGKESKMPFVLLPAEVSWG